MTTSPVMTVTDELLAELEELAAGATEGPWTYETDEDSCYGAVFVKPDTEHYSPPICRIDNDVTAEFVAATDPTTIMALTAELRRLRAENAELAKDAGRYRWIVKKSTYGISYRQCPELTLPIYAPDHRDGLGDAIDTAMADQ